MRWIPLFLVLILGLVTALPTPAAAPGPKAGQQHAPVTSLTDGPAAKAPNEAPAQAPVLTPGRHNVRMKAVSTTYARPLRHDRDLKPVGQVTPASSVVLAAERQHSLSGPEHFCPRADGQRSPLSLQQTPPDNTRVASLSAQRLLSLAQRDLTTPSAPVILMV